MGRGLHNLSIAERLGQVNRVRGMCQCASALHNRKLNDTVIYDCAPAAPQTCAQRAAGINRLHCVNENVELMAPASTTVYSASLANHKIPDNLQTRCSNLPTAQMR